jgi:hypothetical protein
VLRTAVVIFKELGDTEAGGNSAAMLIRLTTWPS